VEALWRGTPESEADRRVLQSIGFMRWVMWLPALSLVCVGCGGGTTRVRRHIVPVPVAVAVAVRARSPASTVGEPVDPSRFAGGACAGFSPTSTVRHVTVFLDAGHGGRDPGAVGRTASGQTIHESTETLAVELDTMAILRAHGFRVVVSRTRDSSVLRLGPNDVSGAALTVEGSHADVLARDVCANAAHANALVGIYFNAGAAANAGSVTGYDAARPFAAENLRLARLLQADVLGAMNARGWGIPNDGVQQDAGLGAALNARALAYGHLVLLGPAARGYVPIPSRMPGALIEPLFITDPFEGSIAASRQGQQVIAGALAKAIEQYFGDRVQARP
jgi:N-acetylmuramoyl-L-alanine amidase